MKFTAKNVQEWAAIYYAMVEQVDTWIGYLLNELDAQGQANNTLIVFTADHGEFLGAHGMRGKLGFFEEALRVPLLMRLPGAIADGTIVERPVSHLDVFATIMDYLGLTTLDESDGKSLRPVIDGTDYHQHDGDGVVVSEDDTPDVINKNVGGFPNFMVRHGPWKLILPKLATSETEDILYNLHSDPYERTNLLHRQKVGAKTIGKLEHLKCLLIEWMKRNDGAKGYYSRRLYNGFDGRGDIVEIRQRRTWPAVNHWISDTTIKLDQPVLVNGKWRTTAWLYTGRTKQGTLSVLDIKVAGRGRRYFRVSKTKGKLRHNECMKIRISFSSDTPVDPTTLEVNIFLRSEKGRRTVKIIPWS
jgi:hypothetical protein